MRACVCVAENGAGTANGAEPAEDDGDQFRPSSDGESGPASRADQTGGPSSSAGLEQPQPSQPSQPRKRRHQRWTAAEKKLLEGFLASRGSVPSIEDVREFIRGVRLPGHTASDVRQKLYNLKRKTKENPSKI